MSERIKELIKEVGTDVSGKWMNVDNIEKLAELIVRDCLGIVNRKEYSYHEADPLWETAQLIKQHFGIEE